MNIVHLSDLYHHFDQLAAQDVSSDELFASSYIRGFIALSAGEFGDENQVISAPLIEHVSESMAAARTELSPGDREVVKRYWQQLIKQLAIKG
ncbi:YfcL family protein [Thalassotalea sp. 1_MG-2023]|uniref:YfcL family protein n=1 Tax=Thalassotalea sp. 1_MG-2023 TaxID=3062680 RepID=UPI0026E43853|nr:YfcL family protein [Thalassotalea sp. 1_MG-2023]MDO6426622.1 YfcL family protein [Thalassotalea sp. 1_MG-2023]